MSTTRSFTSTFAGKAAAPYLLASVFSGSIANISGIGIHTGVKFKEVLKKMTSSSVVQSGSTCQDWSPTGTYTISEVVLQPKPLFINAEFCFSDFYALWDSPDMADGMNAENPPANWEDAVIQNQLNHAMQTSDKLQAIGAATGLTGLDTLITGLATQAKAGTGNDQKVAGLVLTASNILAEINKVFDALPSNVPMDTNELVLIMSKKALFLYKQALVAAGLSNFHDVTKDTPESIYGVEIVAVDGLSARPNVMLLQERKNIHIGYDLKSDEQEISIIDFRYTTGAEKVGFKAKWKFDIKYAFPNEVVIYGHNFV
jgi:hypothetical protein